MPPNNGKAADSRLRAGRQKGDVKKKREANLETLNRVRIAADDTSGLLPRPDEHPDWKKRFDVAEMERAWRTAKEPEPDVQLEMAFPDEEKEESPAPSGSFKRRTKYNPDQEKLF